MNNNKLFSASEQNKKALEEPSVSDVQERGDGYEIKLNGDIVWPCPECDKNGIIKADNKYYSYHKSNTDKLKERKCVACFTKGNEKNNDVQERIAFHGSWNLAVGMCQNAPHAICPDESDPRMQELLALEKWQKYFYERLTNRDK